MIDRRPVTSLSNITSIKYFFTRTLSTTNRFNVITTMNTKNGLPFTRYDVNVPSDHRFNANLLEKRALGPSRARRLLNK